MTGINGSERPPLRKLFLQALTVMTNAFRRLESRLDPPERVPHEDSFVYRYREKGIPQALVQKLARSISGLNAIDLLLLNGFLQEQGVMQRTLDEIHQDIFFLALAVTNDEITDRHRKYLEVFYDDPVLRLGSHAERFRKPDLVPRRKIHAYVRRAMHGVTHDPDQLEEVVSAAYSGYVHAASPYIMDMCDGDPPRFRVAGIDSPERIKDHVLDAWNYYYRGLLATAAVANAFGDEPLVKALSEYTVKFEKHSGKTYMRPDSET